MTPEDLVYVETIAHDDSDEVTVLYAHAVGTAITSAIVRNLSPAARRSMLDDLDTAQARGDNPDDVAAAWAAMEGVT